MRVIDIDFLNLKTKLRVSDIEVAVRRKTKFNGIKFKSIFLDVFIKFKTKIQKVFY